jgi:hypothetical protein
MAGGANDVVQVAMLKKALDASTAISASLLETMPAPATLRAANGVGGHQDMRL